MPSQTYFDDGILEHKTHYGTTDTTVGYEAE